MDMTSGRKVAFLFVKRLQLLIPFASVIQSFISGQN